MTGGYQDDGDSLKGVLQCLESTYTREGIQVPRDPDEDVVRLLLDSGVEALVDRFITYQDSGTEAYTNANEVLGVSLNTVMARFALKQPDRYPIKRDGTRTKAHRDRITNRWKTASRYQRDLLRYVFRLSVDRQRIQDLTYALPQMFEMSFGDLVGSLAESETDSVQRDPLLRLRLVLQTAFPSDPEILALTGKAYRLSAQNWAGIYEAISGAYGLDLDLRSGFGFVDIAQMFNAVVEGSYLRRTIDPALGTLSDGSHVAVRMIQMLISQMSGRPWAELAELRATTPPQ